MTINVQGLARVSLLSLFNLKRKRFAINPTDPTLGSSPSPPSLSQGKFLPLCLYFGESGAKKNYAHQLKNVVNSGYKILGERPQILGELGVPMDLK